MAITEKVLIFYDELLDGNGLAKLINVGARKGFTENRIKKAAEIVYDRHQIGYRVDSLTAAKRVFHVAKYETLKRMQRKEVQTIAKEMDELLEYIKILEKKILPFRMKLYLWWPNEIHFF